MTGAARKTRLDEDWKDQAACKDSWDLFFGPDSTEVAAWQVEEARKLCNSCIVQPDCNQYAEARNEKHGVWGSVNREKTRANRSAV